MWAIPTDIKDPIETGVGIIVVAGVMVLSPGILGKQKGEPLTVWRAIYLILTVLIPPGIPLPQARLEVVIVTVLDVNYNSHIHFPKIKFKSVIIRIMSNLIET